MTCELDIIDCFGARVVLDHSNWEKHDREQRHPEVVPYHDRFVDVLTQPDYVVRAARDGQLHFYRWGIGTGRYARMYLHVVVERFEPVSKVMTWWFTPGLDRRGEIIWPN